MTPFPRIHIRIAALFVTVAGLAATACDKGGEGAKEPDGGPAVETDEHKPGYGGATGDGYPAEGFSLIATTQVEFELSSAQGSGTAKVSARSLIEATAAKDGKREVHGKLIELFGYEGSGQMAPEYMKEQEEPVDIIAEVGKAESWAVIDAGGKPDDSASRNQGVDFGFFSLPSLPSVDLVLDQKAELPAQEDRRQLPFGEIPVVVEESWTLRKIEGQVAEFDMTREVSGTMEINEAQGTALYTALEETSARVIFNLETKLPVSFERVFHSETTLAVQGKSFSFSTNSKTTTSYEISEAAPAT